MDNSDQTQLHLAAETNNLEKAELLMREGVDIHMKNDQGLTPLFILIQQRVEKFNSIHKTKNDQINMNEKFIILLLKHGSSHDKCPEDIRLLNFIAACTLKNGSIAENLVEKMDDINQAINVEYPTFAGYTALHFASLCNVNMVKMLVSKGASLVIQDVKGVTPLEICTKLYSIEEVQSILKSVPAWKDILFSDGKTKLMDYISSLHDPKHHAEFLTHLGHNVEITLSKNSPLWPGYTVLHIAVILLPQENRKIFKKILACSTAILNKPDIHGTSALHLAFRLNKLKLVELLFKHYKKPVNTSDKDNLTYLHIAASINDQKLVEILLETEKEFNVAYTGDPLTTVKPGWTPLHTAVYTKHPIVARMLVERGADFLRRDSKGFTGIHLLFCGNYTDKIAELFFDSDQLKECIANDFGLTHLHVASWRGKTEAIKRLLDLGSDIEATIGKLEDERLAKYEGCRAIHLAMMSSERFNTAYEFLLQNGADVLAKKLDGTSPLSHLLTSRSSNGFFGPTMNLLKNSEGLQKRIKEEMGITMLHIACYECNVESILKELNNGSDVNARVRDDSTIWPGYSPMHVLIFRTQAVGVDTPSLMDNLVAKGADVTMPNADGDTPALMAMKSQYVVMGTVCAANIVKRQMNFKINPVNKAGMSHFHIACLINDAETVEKFLTHTEHIDVNRKIDTGDKSRFAGQTPLLLALSDWSNKNCNADSQIKTVNLLLEHGANVHTFDVDGYTAVHKLAACKLTRESLFPKLLIDNADINKRANDGKTPIEIMLTEGAPSDQVQYLVNQGARINSYNPLSNVGYLAIVIEKEQCRKSITIGEILEMMENSPDIAEVSESGRNAIHNLVANESKSERSSKYIKWIKELMRLGCDISQQDDQGKTALHLAVKFQNHLAVEPLLHFGADVNVVDMDGKTPFFYVSQSHLDKEFWETSDHHASIGKTLAIYLRKRQLVGIPVSELNTKLLRKFMVERTDVKIKSMDDKLNLQLEKMKEMKMCSRGFTVRDFLNPRGVNLYSSSKKADRKAIDSFFKSKILHEVSLWIDLLKLQHKNATQRIPLIEPAVIGLRTLFPLPDLCIDIVLKYLSNNDLENLKATACISL